MKKAIAVGALCATTLAACAHEGRPSRPTATPSELQIADHVRANVLPARLPALVRHAVAAQVSIQFSYSKLYKRTGDINEYRQEADFLASGVRIARNEYLSAGHLIDSGNDKQLPGINYCGNIVVYGPSNQVTAEAQSGTSSKIYDLRGSDLPATRVTSSYYAGDQSKTPDISLILAKDQEGTLPGQPIVSISPVPARKGQAVFFINYEPTSDGQSRSPSEQEVVNLGGYALPPETKLLKPAIYGGVVTSILENGDLQVADGWKSYGKVTQTMTVPGGSGGAVLNSFGQLVGTSVEATSVKLAMSSRDFGTYTAVDLTGLPPSTLTYETIVQPVSPQLLFNLQAELAVAQACHYDPSSLGQLGQ